MSFKNYLTEMAPKEFTLDQIISQREKIQKQLKNLEKYISKDSIKNYKLAVSLISPEKLKKIDTNVITESSQLKRLEKSIMSLIHVTDGLLNLPYYGPENEKIIKEDFYNQCKAISILIYTKIDPKYLNLTESIKESRSKGMLIGSILGGALGGAIAGPVGVLAGILLGAKPGKDAEDNFKQYIEELKMKLGSKANSINWTEVAANIGIILGTVGGLMTLGGVAGFVAGGLIGGTVSVHLQQTVQEKGGFMNIIGSGIKSGFKKMKSFVLKFNDLLISKQKKLEKDLKSQYKIRIQKIKSLS